MKGKDHLEDLRVDGPVILKCIFKEHGVIAWTGCCECANGTSRFRKACIS